MIKYIYMLLLFLSSISKASIRFDWNGGLMITEKSIKSYHFPAMLSDDNNLVIAPHELLRPFIANYTFTNPRTMSEQQTVLPSVSSTLVYSVGNNGIINGLRGVNTKPTTIGDFARQFNFMFLIEFHSAGLYPFIKIDQNLLLDNSFSFEDLSKSLNKQITEAYFMSTSIDMLKQSLDNIFLSKLDNTAINPTVQYAMKRILENRGTIRTKELAGDVYYSEKHLNRLFQKHIGTGVKTFSRIVRMKQVIDLLGCQIALSQLAEITGHYDLSHFAHDFKDVYGITPKEYMSKMSFFYNDPFKLDRYNEIDYNKYERNFKL